MPQHHGSPCAADDPEVRAIVEGQPVVVHGVVEYNPLLQMGTGRRQCPEHIERCAHAKMPPEQQRSVVLALGQLEELLAHRPRRLKIPTREVKAPQPCQSRRKLAGIIDLLTQRLCPGVRSLNLWSRRPPR